MTQHLSAEWMSLSVDASYLTGGQDDHRRVIDNASIRAAFVSGMNNMHAETLGDFLDRRSESAREYVYQVPQLFWAATWGETGGNSLR